VLAAGDPVHLPALLVDALGLASRGEARRLIQQGGVSVDGEPVGDVDIARARVAGRVLKAGKRRFVRLVDPA
jgi:tyrosyl-tRNA synthetase